MRRRSKNQQMRLPYRSPGARESAPRVQDRRHTDGPETARAAPGLGPAPAGTNLLIARLWASEESVQAGKPGGPLSPSIIAWCSQARANLQSRFTRLAGTFIAQIGSASGPG